MTPLVWNLKVAAAAFCMSPRTFKEMVVGSRQRAQVRLNGKIYYDVSKLKKIIEKARL